MASCEESSGPWCTLSSLPDPGILCIECVKTWLAVPSTIRLLLNPWFKRTSKQLEPSGANKKLLLTSHSLRKSSSRMRNWLSQESVLITAGDRTRIWAQECRGPPASVPGTRAVAGISVGLAAACSSSFSSPFASLWCVYASFWCGSGHLKVERKGDFLTDVAYPHRIKWLNEALLPIIRSYAVLPGGRHPFFLPPFSPQQHLCLSADWTIQPSSWKASVLILNETILMEWDSCNLHVYDFGKWLCASVLYFLTAILNPE